jgi:hypothetical protein
VEENFSRATYVFVGRVISAQEIRRNLPLRSGVIGTFELIESIKGNPETLAVVESGYGGGDCGVPLLVGSTYIFFADPSGNIAIYSGTRGYTQGYGPDDTFLHKLQDLAHPAKRP